MRRSESPFEYRGQWLGQERGRAGWYRFWYDDGKRKIARRSLSASSLEEAKEELVEILGGEPPKADAPDKVLLSDVLNHYTDHKYPPATRAAELVLLALETITPYPKVSDLTRTNQRQVWSHIHDTTGIKPKSISTYMISVRAAINFAAQPQIVTIDDKEVEIRLLNEPVPVFCNEQEIADHLDAETSSPREFLPTAKEVARWIDAIEDEDDFRYAILALNTWARNSAIFDLRVDRQVDFEYGIVDLNPPGRRQTKKRRPVIRLTRNLRGWLKHWKANRPIRQYQDTVEKRLNILGKPPEVGDDGRPVRPDLKMPEFTCYTLRHFMTTQCRRTSVPVSREQRSQWLGHVTKEGSRTTDWYEKFDPDYLESAMNATDEIISTIAKHTRRSLVAPTVHPRSGFRVVEGGKKTA